VAGPLADGGRGARGGRGGRGLSVGRGRGRGRGAGAGTGVFDSSAARGSGRGRGAGAGTGVFDSSAARGKAEANAGAGDDSDEEGEEEEDGGGGTSTRLSWGEDAFRYPEGSAGHGAAVVHVHSFNRHENKERTLYSWSAKDGGEMDEQIRPSHFRVLELHREGSGHFHAMLKNAKTKGRFKEHVLPQFQAFMQTNFLKNANVAAFKVGMFRLFPHERLAAAAKRRVRMKSFYSQAADGSNCLNPEGYSHLYDHMLVFSQRLSAEDGAWLETELIDLSLKARRGDNKNRGGDGQGARTDEDKGRTHAAVYVVWRDTTKFNKKIMKARSMPQPLPKPPGTSIGRAAAAASSMATQKSLPLSQALPAMPPQLPPAAAGTPPPPPSAPASVQATPTSVQAVAARLASPAGDSLVAHDAPAAAGAAAAAGDADGGKSSPYHGVTWNKQRGGWQVRIKDSGAAGAAGAKAATYTKQFGRSDDDERRAAEHRDEKFREWGVKKAMNFPQAGTDETQVPLQEKAKKGATRGRAEELQPIGEPLAAPVAAPPVAQQAAAEPPVAVLPPRACRCRRGPGARYSRRRRRRRRQVQQVQGRLVDRRLRQVAVEVDPHNPGRRARRQGQDVDQQQAVWLERRR
jgi:hypothetical protein